MMERSPDGRWLLLKSWSDTAYLWSLVDGQLSARIAIPSWSGRNVVAFSPDGNTLAMAGGSNGLYLWETKTGRPLRSFQKFPWNIQRAWFTADGGSIVTYSSGESVFRIVHLDPRKGRRGEDGRDTRPVQAVWPAYIDPAAKPRVSFGSVSGFVRVSPTQTLPDAEVLLYDGTSRDEALLARTSTNAAGHYLIQGLKVPHVIVRASKFGFRSEVRYVHADERATADLLLKAQSGH